MSIGKHREREGLGTNDGGNSRRVLLAEADEVAREQMATALVEVGYEVIGVENGAELVECIDIIARDALRPPDVIAIDVCSPSHTAIDLLEGLRSAGWMTPAIVITDRPNGDLFFRAQLAGSTVVLEKPFSPMELRAAALHARKSAVPPSLGRKELRGGLR